MTRYLKFFASSILAAGVVLQPIPVIAADEPKSETELETDRLKAEAGLVSAKAALEKARLDALNLPNFKNETDLSTANAGQIEAVMLASRAVKVAAASLATKIKDTTCADTTFIVLTGAEKIDLNQPRVFNAQIASVKNQLELALFPDGDIPESSSVGALIGVANAVAGLFGNETKVSPVDLSSIDATMLTQVLAGALFDATKKCWAKSPSGGFGIADLQTSEIVTAMNTIQNLRLAAVREKASFGDKPSDSQKARIVVLDAAIKAQDDFAKAATTVDANGNMPLVTAALLHGLAASKTKIVRIWVNKAGGSLINTKNIATMFGLDPVKVSGGLVVTYSVVDASNGQVEKSGLLTCQTSLASLRKIQTGKWKAKSSSDNEEVGGAICT